MNYRMIWQTLGRVLSIEAALMALPLICTFIYGEDHWGFVMPMALTGAAGAALLIFSKPVNTAIYAKEGFIMVGLSWVLMSLFGALPFVISGCIPNYIDALFETVSGFTTTGASILTDVEAMPYGMLFWRSFTHWVGGMGVLVFLMAVLPMSGEYSMHIMRAEVPGPVVGKLVPRVRKTARILYIIYVVMTVIETVMLICGGMSLFDALIHSFGTAGTGGFSSKALSVGYYDSAYIDIVIGVFMLLFGVNFNLYFLIIIGRAASALKSEELRWYIGIVAFSVVTIALSLRGAYGSVGGDLRYAFFQVSSIITTTGYATANFDLWPEYARWLLVLLMFVGACAGSTGGGMKVSRVIILAKASACEIRRLLRPRSVSRVKQDGRAVDELTVRCTLVFAVLYVATLLVSTLAISLDGFDTTTNFTASIACLSNIGPGLGLVGPMGGFSMYSWLSKLVLSACMLLGRLEIYPILMLLSPGIWKRN